MGDIVNIGIRYDTSQLKTGVQDMDRVTASGKKMEAQVEKVGSASQRMGNRVKDAQAQIRELSNAAGVLTGPLGGLSGRLSAFGRLLGNVNTSMALAVLGLAGFGAGLLALTAAITRSADEMILLEARVRNVTTATNDFKGVWNGLGTIAKSTGVSLRDTIDVFSRIQIGARDLGKSNADVLRLVETVEKLGVMSGTGKQGLNAGLLQLGQAFSAGIVRAEEFNSIVENMPKVAQAIGDSLGKSIGELKQMTIAGKLMSKDVFEGLLKKSVEVDQAFRKFPVSIERARNSAKISFDLMALNIDKNLGLTKLFSSAITKLADAFDFLGTHIDEVVISLGTLAGVMAALAIPVIIQQVTRLAEAIKLVGNASIFTTIAQNIAAFSAFQSKIPAQVNAGADAIKKSFTTIDTSMMATMKNTVQFGDYMKRTSAGYAGVTAETAAAAWNMERATLSAFTRIQVAGVGLRASLASISAAFGGLLVTLLTNPWTYVVAGIVAVGVALLNLKKEVQSTTKSVVTWKDVFVGIAKTIAEEWDRACKLVSGAVTGMISEIDQALPGFAQGLQNIGNFFKDIANWAKSATQEAITFFRLAAMAQDNPLIQKAMDKAGPLTGGASRLFGPVAKEIIDGYDRLKKNIRDEAEKRGADTSSDKPNSDRGIPKPTTQKAKKDSMAQRIANLTKDVNADLAAAETMLHIRETLGEAAFLQVQARKEAENEIRQKNLKLSPEKFEDLVGKVAKTNMLKKDIEMAGQFNLTKEETNRINGYVNALDVGRDQGIYQRRTMDIDKEMDKYKGSESGRADFRRNEEAKQVAEHAAMLKELSVEMDEQFRQQKMLNDAQAKGELAYKNTKITIDALNEARAKNKDLLDEEVDAIAKRNAEAKKADMAAALNEDIRLRDKAIEQTHALNVAMTQGTEAYRIAKLEIEAYNEALANGNTLTDEDIRKLKERIVQQAEADRQLEITTQRVQGIKQLYNDLGSAFAGAFTDAVTGVHSFRDALKQLMKDLLAILAKKFIFDKIVGFLAGNANGSGKFGTQGLFGKLLGYGATAVSAVNPAAGAALSVGSAVAGATKFAKGGIVNSPHIFPFASGVGLMGEAGPESIMPLRRLPNGDLGVQAMGGGGGAVINNNVHVTVENTGGGKGNSDDNQEMANKISKTITDQLKSMVADQIKEQMRPGNALNPGTSYR